MADFKFSLDMDSIFPQGLDDENLALDMVKAGQVVMQKSIQRAAQKHVKTGSMVNSVSARNLLLTVLGTQLGA